MSETRSPAAGPAGAGDPTGPEAPAWVSPGRVMVDHFGCPYLTLDADNVLAGYCRDLNFPEVTLATIGQLDLL